MHVVQFEILYRIILCFHTRWLIRNVILTSIRYLRKLSSTDTSTKSIENLRYRFTQIACVKSITLDNIVYKSLIKKGTYEARSKVEKKKRDVSCVLLRQRLAEVTRCRPHGTRLIMLNAWHHTVAPLSRHNSSSDLCECVIRGLICGLPIDRPLH